MQSYTYLTIALTAALGACTGGDDTEIVTTTEGQARYQDSESDSEGNPRPAAHPEPRANDPMMIEVIVDGQAEMSGLDPECTLDGTTGSFEGFLAGDAELDDDGGYFALMSANEAAFETPSGCQIPELDIVAVSEVTLRATLTTTETRCDGYCSARARSYAEAQCDGAADRASCWSTATSEYQASCTAACQRDDTRVIVAETELSATQMAELDPTAFEGAVFGDIRADLTFDYLEDTGGEPVDESP